MPHNADFIGKLQIKLIWYKLENSVLWRIKKQYDSSPFCVRWQLGLEYQLWTQCQIQKSLEGVQIFCQSIIHAYSSGPMKMIHCHRSCYNPENLESC